MKTKINFRKTASTVYRVLSLVVILAMAFGAPLNVFAASWMDQGDDPLVPDKPDKGIGQHEIELTKTGDPLSKIGDMVDYTITLANNSSLDTPDLECTVTDAMVGVDEDFTIAAGDQPYEINIYDFEIPIGAADPFVNTASVVCSPIGSMDEYMDDAMWETELFQPAIELSKTGDAMSMIGDMVDYTITLANNSSLDTPDLECTVTDAMVGVNEDFTIAAGDLPYEINVYDFEIPIDAADPFINTASAVCSPMGFPNLLLDDAMWETSLSEPKADYWAFTPGFWKNHTSSSPSGHDAWQYTAYETGDLLLDVGFVLGELGSEYPKGSMTTFNEKTLLEALRFKGGANEVGALEILLRAGVASLLNASFHEVMHGTVVPYFPLTSMEVIAAVNAAIASGDRWVMLELAAELDDYNNGDDYFDWTWDVP